MYRCDHCKDTGWCTSKVLDDGTELKVMCYCHPLVQAGKAKALDGSFVLSKLKKRRGKYDLPEGD